MVTRGSFITICALGVLMFTAEARPTAVQDQPVAAFKAGVDLVRVSAVVRDRKGRFVQDLSARDFEILDGGLKRSITDFRNDLSGVSIALLFDVSGSMEAKLPNAREAAEHVLSWLDAETDEAAVFTFDTRLDRSHAVHERPEDAARRRWRTSRRLAPRRCTTRSRRQPSGSAAAKAAGARSSSSPTATTTRAGSTRGSVASIASAIDVPVYIFGVVRIDRQSVPRTSRRRRRSTRRWSARSPIFRRGPAVTSLRRSTPGQRSIAARQIVDELRHQYLIAFESSGKPGWHPLVVRARDKDLTVRARSGYIAGQSRPNS